MSTISHWKQPLGTEEAMAPEEEVTLQISLTPEELLLITTDALLMARVRVIVEQGRDTSYIRTLLEARERGLDISFRHSLEEIDLMVEDQREQNLHEEQYQVDEGERTWTTRDAYVQEDGTVVAYVRTNDDEDRGYPSSHASWTESYKSVDEFLAKHGTRKKWGLFGTEITTTINGLTPEEFRGAREQSNNVQQIDEHQVEWRGHSTARQPALEPTPAVDPYDDFGPEL